MMARRALEPIGIGPMIGMARRKGKGEDAKRSSPVRQRRIPVRSQPGPRGSVRPRLIRAPSSPLRQIGPIRDWWMVAAPIMAPKPNDPGGFKPYQRMGPTRSERVVEGLDPTPLKWGLFNRARLLAKNQLFPSGALEKRGLLSPNCPFYAVHWGLVR